MENVMAAIELAGILFKCSVVVVVGIYALNLYRSKTYSYDAKLKKSNNKIFLHKNSK